MFRVPYSRQHSLHMHTSPSYVLLPLPCHPILPLPRLTPWTPPFQLSSPALWPQVLFLMHLIAFLGQARTVWQEMAPFGVSSSILTSDGPPWEFWGDKNVKPTSRYEIIPYVFFKVKAKFFEETFKTGLEKYPKEVKEKKLPSNFVTSQSPSELKRQFHLENDLVYTEHTRWNWAACEIGDAPDCQPSKVSLADEVTGSSKMMHMDSYLLINMKRDRRRWKAFVQKFLTWRCWSPKMYFSEPVRKKTMKIQWVQLFCCRVLRTLGSICVAV